MGYIRGLVHGAVLGTAIGLLVAPQEGERTREQVRAAAERTRQSFDAARAGARRAAPQVLEAAEAAGGVMAGLRARVLHREQADDAYPGIDITGSAVPAGGAAPIGGGAPSLPG
jgi:phytoene/squalene synthetase